MDLRTFLIALGRNEREPFAKRCGTTFGRLLQVAYGNDPATPGLCVALDRESGGVVSYRSVNDAWEAKKGACDTRKRILPVDWDYVEQKARAEADKVA
jgi:hypothetical protein